MITLHESNITSFPLDNGIGVLRDAILAYTEEETNGLFEFYMEYDSEGHLVDELKEERIIKAKAQDKLGYQLFRIYSITKNHENDNLIVNAQHITYDLANNFVEQLVATSMTKKQVMEKIGSSTALPHPFNLTSSNTTTISSTQLYRTNPIQMIAGMDGSVLQIWGGQLERDNFNLILHDRRGHDDGVTVTYEKNITGLEADFDISGLVTRIFPYVYIEAIDNEPERLITITGKYIDSPLINAYNKIYIKPIDYSHDERIDTQDKTDAQIRAQLESIANRYFEETDNDKPKATMDVAFAHLWETEEYKDVKVLELVGMGDTVTINHSRLKVDATAIVNYIRYDCIAGVNEEVLLGNVKAGLTDSLNKIDAIERKAEQAESNANRAIVSANGKNTTFYGPDEPSSAQKGDLWFELVDGQYNRTYRYDGIEWQLIIDMDSQEAKVQAQQAKVDAQQSLTTANDAINTAQASFDKALENATLIDDLGIQIGDVETGLTTISGTVDGLQTTVTDLAGNVSNLTQLSNVLQSTVSSLQDDWDNLEIGGRNLIRNSDFSNPDMDISDWRNKLYADVEIINGKLTYNFHTVHQAARIEKLFTKLEINKTYTFTLFMRNYSSKELELRGIVGAKIIKSEIPYESNEFSLYHIIFKATSDTETIIRLYVVDVEIGDLFEIDWVKLEHGTIPTDWTPAPEDMATQSQITQLSDAINLRVEKGDIINQINISDESILISGKKLLLDGDTTVTGSFRVNNANITSIDVGKLTTGTLDAGRISVINLSANSIVGGILQSQNSNTTFNLNTGELFINDNNIVFGNSANIMFNDRGNQILHTHHDDISGYTRSAGLGVGRAIGNRYPFAYLGANNADTLDTLGQYFSGFIANSYSRILTDDAANAIYGQRLRLIDKADYANGITFDFFGSTTEISSWGNHLNLGILNRLYGLQAFSIRNYFNNAIGWLVETQYSGSGAAITFRGLNAGSYNYQIGSTGSRILNIYLSNSPNVSSDERLKTDISDLDLGLEFIKRIEAKQFRLKLTDADISQGKTQNPTQYGIIAQQVNSVLADFGVYESSLINKGDDDYYGAQYEQFIPTLIKSVQELDTKFTDDVEFLKLKVQYLEQRLEAS